MPFCDVVSPDYNIIYFVDGFYKIVKFHHGFGLVRLSADADDLDLDSCRGKEKFDSSFSRARKNVFEKALCNPWDWFVTVTLDQSKMYRYDLRNFREKLSQFMRDMRKKYGSKIAFLLVPEPHSDGAWHMHGFLSGLPDSALSDFMPGVHPLKLCGKGYKNWDDYSKKFGYCSLSPIRNRVKCAFYITKYISKSLGDRRYELGSHLYFGSQGLLVAQKAASFIGSSAALDSYLDRHYDFCSTGFAMDTAQRPFGWVDLCDFDSFIEPLDLKQFDEDPPLDIVEMQEAVEQLSLGGFE